MLFHDALTLDAPRRTSDGYLALRAKAARVGVYKYTGREIDPDNQHGLRDQAIVNVLRDEKTVFDAAAVRSFIGKPVTDDHPSQAVTSSNWRDHARGSIMGALRDGDYLAFDILLTDSALIQKVEDGKRDLSNGYGAEIEFGDFKHTDGTVCQARQSRITGGNHVAVVRDGRAGKDCSIHDFASCDALPQAFLDSLSKETTVPKTMLIDGLTVDIANADTAEATIKTLLAARDAAASKASGLETQVVTDAATIVAKDAEIARLNQQLADARLTPAQMREAGKAYAIVVDKAKASGVTVTDSMDETAIMRAVCDKAMGDKAKDYSDEHIAVAFEALTKDVKVSDAPSFIRPLAHNDAATDYAASHEKRKAALSDAWRQPAAANA
jgi:hypothetical protein